MTVTGLALAGAPNSTETRTSIFGGTYQEENHGGDVLGGLLAITGAVLVIAGALSHDEHETHTVWVPQPYAYAPVYVPPVVAEPTPPHPVVVDAPNAQTVIFANTVIVENPPAAANPTADLP